MDKLEQIKARQTLRHMGPPKGAANVPAIAFLIARADIDWLVREVERLRDLEKRWDAALTEYASRED